MSKIIVKYIIWVGLFLSLNASIGGSYSYWLNGWRKNSGDKSADILVIETPHYLFSLDTADLSSSYFAPSKKDFKYGLYGANYKEIEKLKKVPLSLSISVGSDKYVARASKASKHENLKPLQDVLLWEAGRYCQHFDFKDLEFVNANGEILPLYSDLKLVAWEDSFALTLNTQKGEFYEDGAVEGVVNNAHCIKNTKLVFPENKLKALSEFTASIWLNIPEKFWQVSNGKGTLLLCGKSSTAKGAWGIKLEDIYACSAFLKASSDIVSSTVKVKKGWNLLCLSFDGDSLKFFLNGKLSSSTPLKGASFSPVESALILGASSERTSSVHSSLVDEFRLWDKALSSREIRDMYESPKEILAKENLIFENNFDDSSFKDKKYKSLKNAKLEMSLLNHKVSKTLSNDLQDGKLETLTLPVSLKDAEKADVKLSINGKNIDVAFDEKMQCYMAVSPKLVKSSSEPYECDYSDFNLSVKGEGQVPFLLRINSPSAITGLCPILCYKDGTPTGIQVQLSKNWHERILGSYLMAYTKIPQGDYILRIAYGYYGKYPSVSHANLSLVGYGGSGRWEQLAVGAWGETICFDADNSLVTNMITDIRMLMARDGKDGKKWGWTDAGWGGDWFRIGIGSKERLMPVGLKTSYISQGPCLTDVRYEGYLGEGREVSMRARVQSTRANDYARTFQRLEYKFNENFTAQDYSLYNLRNLSATIFMGDKSGVVESYENTGGDSKVELGFGGKVYPLWFSAVGRDVNRIKAVGYKALAIRSFEAKIGSKTYREPSIVYDEKLNAMDLILPKQNGSISFKKGDSILMDIELFTLHARAEDYYGDDEVYRQHLEENPFSYKTAQREALGNDLQVKVKGGELLRAYPVEIFAKDKEVVIDIQGGVGLVPLRVENIASGDYALYKYLDDAKLEKLEQSVRDNDFYQLEYDSLRKSYTYVFNLPLRGGQSRWILKK